MNITFFNYDPPSWSALLLLSPGQPFYSLRPYLKRVHTTATQIQDDGKMFRLLLQSTTVSVMTYTYGLVHRIVSLRDTLGSSIDSRTSLSSSNTQIRGHRVLSQNIATGLYSAKLSTPSLTRSSKHMAYSRSSSY